ncbi:MAG TPA: DUF1614 domain-containing protein [Acidimicrobiales bacterium]
MTVPFIVGMIVLFLLTVALVEVGAMNYVYHRLGIDQNWAFGLLLGAIVGSRINVPIARFQGKVTLTNKVVSHFGVRYRIPEVVRTGETIVALNVGGAAIPAGLATYLIVHDDLWVRALEGVLIVSLVINRMARAVPGIGVVAPTLVPPLVAVLAAAAIGGGSEAALAYVAGTLGTLIGADLLHMPSVRKWGAPMVSIGGAGTFDGIFLTGLLAVLLAAR